MKYADIKPYDVANGPGVRVSLFVSGCRHHCPGCFNQAALDFNYGKPFTDNEISMILNYLEPDYIQGITLLGGEPFEPVNQLGLITLLQQIKERFPKKDIWSFSGFTYEALTTALIHESSHTLELLDLLDVLVDGPFVLALRDPSLRFKGSSNQRTIDMRETRRSGQLTLLSDE